MENKFKLKIIKGRFKTIRLKITNNGEITISAPNSLNDEKIKEFILSKQRWLDKQMLKINEMNKIKEQYKFDNCVYLFGKPYLCKEDKSKVYSDYFLKIIKPLVNELSIEYNLKYKSVDIANSKRIWGSLDNNKKMRLNWKIVILPKDLVIYIITHELCHSKEFNHSKKFWQLVEKYLPNYKDLRNHLKMYSFLLSSKVL